MAIVCEEMPHVIKWEESAEIYNSTTGAYLGTFNGKEAARAFLRAHFADPFACPVRVEFGGAVAYKFYIE